MRWVRALSQEGLPKVKRRVVTPDGVRQWREFADAEAAFQPDFESLT